MLPTDKRERKDTPITTGFLDYFPDAVAAVAQLSKVGNEQHNPGEPLRWSRDKSTDHADCISRHLIQRGTFDDDGVRHSAKVAWRALALLQIEIEAANLGARAEEKVRRRIKEDLNKRLAEALANPPLWPKFTMGIDMGKGPDLSACTYATASEAPKLTVDTALMISTPPGLNPSDLGYKAAELQDRAPVTDEVAQLLVKGTTEGNGLHRTVTYIAGPMRGYEKLNFPAFDETRDRMVSRGFTVISPADIDRASGLEEEDDTVSTQAAREFVYRDVMALLTLRPARGDFITMLDGWEKSTGACAELFIARWLGIPATDKHRNLLRTSDFSSGLFFQSLLQWFDDNAAQ